MGAEHKKDKNDLMNWCFDIGKKIDEIKDELVMINGNWVLRKELDNKVEKRFKKDVNYFVEFGVNINYNNTNINNLGIDEGADVVGNATENTIENAIENAIEEDGLGRIWIIIKEKEDKK